MSQLEEVIKAMVAEEVERQLSEKLPMTVRALGIREAEPVAEGLVDALAVARILGRDLSTPENIEKAKRYVYDLARKKKIPSVRISDRIIKFDLAKVNEVLEMKAQEAA